MTQLTILTITQFEKRTEPLRQEMRDLAKRLDAGFVEYDGRGAGILEYVLDDALEECPDGYVLLLADDERCSDEMADWLATRAYEKHDNWAFPRAHLWESEDRYITDSPLWPDLQTRLAVKEKSGGRRHVHDGSPYGTGVVAPVAIEHHKFLLRTREECAEIMAGYEALGAPEHFRVFSIPEPVSVAAYPVGSHS